MSDSSYHSRIMNIQDVEQPYVDPCYKKAYKFGHRDARHAAAEIALEAEREIRELKERLEIVKDDLQGFIDQQ